MNIYSDSNIMFRPQLSICSLSKILVQSIIIPWKTI